MSKKDKKVKGLDFSSFVRDLRTKQFWFSIVGITIAVLIMSAGYVLFTNPYKIIPGGVYGLGRVLHELVPSITTARFGFMFEVPLMLISFFVFGSKFGFRTIYAALITPVFIDLMTYIVGEDPYDGVSLISQYFNFSDNVLTAAIFGGVLIGAGVGLVVKFGATSGGTDIISMMISRFLKMKFSVAMFIVESCVVIIGMLVFKDWKLPLYSLVAIFASFKVVDFVLDGASYDKLLFIITDKNEEMKNFILNDMGRGGTFIKSKGMYSNNDKEMIFLVINKKQITTVQDKIKEIDDKAFVVVVTAYDTFGDGFKEFPQEA